MMLLNRSRTYRESIIRVAERIPVQKCSVLVTGATGLIGSCLVDVLAERNSRIDGNIEIYAMGRYENKLTERFGSSGQIRFIVQNISDPIMIPHLDYIIHAASIADPRKYALYPVETILTNIYGAANTLEYCKKNDTRALLASSFEVYGKLERDEYSEDDFGVIDMNRLRSCYPESKRTAELLFRAYHDEYGIDCVIARLSSIYGPTMQKDDSKAHAQFLKNAAFGEDIVLKSKGDQRRTYCYVLDAVEGLLTVLLGGRSGEAYNVANRNSVTTIRGIAEEIAKQSGSKVVFDLPDEIEMKGFSRPQNCVFRTDKIESLGWHGKYTLQRGVAETLAILDELKFDQY